METLDFGLKMKLTTEHKFKLRKLFKCEDLLLNDEKELTHFTR